MSEPVDVIDAAWALYEPKLRQRLLEEGAELAAVDLALPSLREIFEHHCSPVPVNAKTEEEFDAWFDDFAHRQIAGLLGEIARLKVVIYRLRYGSEPAGPIH